MLISQTPIVQNANNFIHPIETGDILNAVTAENVNSQTGNVYTYVASDNGKLVTHSNASVISAPTLTGSSTATNIQLNYAGNIVNLSDINIMMGKNNSNNTADILTHSQVSIGDNNSVVDHGVCIGGLNTASANKFQGSSAVTIGYYNTNNCYPRSGFVIGESNASTGGYGAYILGSGCTSTGRAGILLGMNKSDQGTSDLVYIGSKRYVTGAHTLGVILYSSLTVGSFVAAPTTQNDIVLSTSNVYQCTLDLKIGLPDNSGKKCIIQISSIIDNGTAYPMPKVIAYDGDGVLTDFDFQIGITSNTLRLQIKAIGGSYSGLNRILTNWTASVTTIA